MNLLKTLFPVSGWPTLAPAAVYICMIVLREHISAVVPLATYLAAAYWLFYGLFGTFTDCLVCDGDLIRPFIRTVRLLTSTKSVSHAFDKHFRGRIIKCKLVEGGN